MQVTPIHWYRIVWLLALMVICQSSLKEYYTSRCGKLSSHSSSSSSSTSSPSSSSSTLSSSSSSPPPCHVHEVTMNHISVHSLENVLESPRLPSPPPPPPPSSSSSSSRYFVVISIKESMSRVNVTAMYEDIDEFLTTHPWWILRQYPSRSQSQHLPVTTTTTTTTTTNAVPILWTHHALDEHREAIFERTPRFVEAMSRGFLAQSFPSSSSSSSTASSACRDRTLYVKTSVGSWGNDIIVNMHSFVERSVGDVHMIYLTHAGDVHDRVGHVEPLSTPQCAHQVDKHTCAFLPISNCSLPAALVRCHGRPECIREGYYRPSTSSTSSIINNDDHHIWSGRDAPKTTTTATTTSNPTHDEPSTRFFPTHFPDYHRRSSSSCPVEYRVGRDVHRGVVDGNLDASQCRRDMDDATNLHAFTGLFNFIYRPNHHLGLHMQSILESFFDRSFANNGTNIRRRLRANGSGPDSLPVLFVMDRTERCHAAHIRMGDRYINRREDMFRWCREHTNASATSSEDRWIGDWIDGRKLTRGQWYNMGCNWRNPFGTLTLQHFVNASVALNPNISHVVVMTDDFAWLNEELKIFQESGTYRDRIQLHIFPSMFKSVHTHRMSFQATAEWWAGIQAARQCEGFIGHTGSAASYSVFRAMCFQHGDEYWQCPPWFVFN